MGIKFNSEIEYKKTLKRLNDKMEIIKLNYNRISELTGIHRKVIGECMKGEAIPNVISFMTIVDALDMEIRIVHKDI